MSINTNRQHHQAVGQTEEQKRFLTYVNTLTLLKTRLRGIDENDFVHIGQKEIEKRFFVYPKFKREEEISKLINGGLLLKEKHYSIKSSRMMDMYNGLRPCGLDASLILPKVYEYGETQRFMLESLLNADLKPNTFSTPYFDFFLKNKNEFPHLFFKFDDFSRRLHTPATSFPSDYRKNILLYGKPVCSLDVTQMQPQILGKILKSQLQENQFSTWMEKGKDIYVMIAEVYKLLDRDAGKKRFFEILFAKPNDNLANVFGNVKWVGWVNWYKRQLNTNNPHKYKLHSNLAWLLQTTEVYIMRSVWEGLKNAGIPFLTIHDEIICSKQDQEAATKIFTEKLEQNFVHFQLNVS